MICRHDGQATAAPVYSKLALDEAAGFVPRMATPSYRDIAAKAGVSQMTVSLALRNHPRVSAATRRRVLAAAERVGYARDAKLGELMIYLRKRRQLRDHTPIAFLNAYRIPGIEKTDPYVTGLFKGALRRGGELGLKLEPFWLHAPDLTQARLANVLYHRGYRGVIVSPLDPLAPKFNFDCRRFTAVATSYSSEFLGINQVLTNRLQGLQLATGRLIEAGFRRIGMVVDEDMEFRSRHMASAYFSWFQSQRPAAERVPLLQRQVLDKISFAAWLKKHRPEVVLTSPIEPYGWIQEMGLKIPQDISYATLSVSSYVDPRLSGIDEKPESIGEVVAETLAAQIHINEFGRPRVHRIIGLDSEWRAGGTLARPRQV